MNLHIFAHMEARDEIPTATPTLSWSVIQMHLSMKPPHVTGSRKCKMTTAKPKVLIFQHVDMMATKYQLLNPCFKGLAIQWDKVGLLYNLTGSDKSKMAASEPEVFIFPLADMIAI